MPTNPTPTKTKTKTPRATEPPDLRAAAHRLALAALPFVLFACSDSTQSEPPAVDDVGTAPDADTSPPGGDDVARPDADAGPIPPDADAEVDTEPPIDVGTDAEPPDEPTLCASCVDSVECGDGNLCLSFPSGGRYCAQDCTLAPCPEGYFCAALDDELGSRQCVPDDLLCENPCDDVECGGGFICDPALDARCVPPRDFCDTCELDVQCGPGNRCLRLSSDEFDNQCMQDCSDGQPCPVGAFCATFALGTEEVRQCVPDSLTCEDRCAGLACDAGEFCDPRVGRCERARDLCAPCDRDLQCGGERDQCVGLPGPDCDGDGDCDAGSVCQEGVCVETRCAIDCTDDPFVCPDGWACFGLADGSQQCLPRQLTCTDRCADVECGEGFNCDVRTGACVASRFVACEAGCETDAECGGPDDACVGLDGRPATCLPGCGDGAPCPLGYDCLSVSSGQELCVPAPSPGFCDACAGIDCSEGSVCNPWDGRCYARPIACSADAECGADERCNRFDGRCEPLGLTCEWATRFAICDLGRAWCTSTRPGVAGTCEDACNTAADCSVERPWCTALQGVLGGVCTSASPAAMERCGQRVLQGSALGRPCNRADDGVGSRVCPDAAADVCVVLPGAGGGPDDGICTRTCDDDADCEPEGGRCSAVDGGASYCVPAACACALPAGDEPGVDEPAAWIREVLDGAEVTACDLRQPVSLRRAAVGTARAEAALPPHGAGDVIEDPARVFGTLRPVTAPLADAGSALERARAVPDVAARAWGTDPVAPVLSTTDASPAELMDAALAAASAEALATEDVAALEALDPALASALARLLDDLLAARVEVEEALAGVDTDAWRVDGALLWPALWPGVLGATDVRIDGADGWDQRFPRSTRAALLGAGARTIDAVAAFRVRARELDLGAWPASGLVVESALGALRIGTPGDDSHTLDAPALLLVDPAGDDHYRGSVAVTSPGHPVSVVVDLGGADRYDYAEVGGPPPEPDLLADDGAGRAAAERGGDGEVSRSNTARFAAGHAGVAVLWDAGPGANEGRTLRGGLGTGVLGVGLLVVEDGAMELHAEAFSCGAGLLGVGAVVLADVPNLVRCRHASAGFGAPGGVGIFVGGAGDDVYDAVDRDAAPLYRDRTCGAGSEATLGYGAAAGRAAPAFEVDRPVAGGVGIFFETGGDDVYHVASAALGFAAFGGLAFFDDMAGADAVDAVPGGECVGGAAVRHGVAMARDRDGADRWGSADAPLARSLAYGESFGVGAFDDEAGDDLRFGGLFSLGAGLINGVGLWVDRGGADRYEVGAGVDALGFAALTIEGREPESNPRRAAATWGLFADLGGVDTYPPEADGGDGERWSRRSPSEADLPVFGFGWDAP